MRYVPLVLLLPILLSGPAAAQAGLRVVAVSPPPNAVTTAPDVSIVITFDAAVDRSSFGHTTMMVFGRWSGVMEGVFTFEENDTRVRFVPARRFLAGETVSVSLSRHVASASGAALGRGYAWRFGIRTQPASLDLRETARVDVRTPQERQDGTWIQTYGAYAGDLDGDGHTDLAVPNERTNDVRVFMNDGTGGYGAFRTYAIPGGDRPSTNEGADFDLDGRIDFAVGNSRGSLVSIFYGDGTGHLHGPQNYETGDGVRGLAVLDADADGYPDVATAQRDAGTVTLLTNNRDGTFTLRPIHRQIGATAIAAADADADGVVDLVVGVFRETGEVLVLLGDGDGGFRLGSAATTGGPVWMIAAGDVNGDGNADVVSANSTGNNASVILLGGHGQILDVETYPTGGFPLAIDLGDLDGDGDLDLVTSNFDGGSWTIYENAGDGTFTNRRDLPASRAGSCAVLHDRDADGTLDMTGIDEVDDLLFLFTNPPVPTYTETPPAARFDFPPGYPNPFSDHATLTLSLDTPAHARLAIYDLLGRIVRVLTDEVRAVGEHRLTWDGRDDAGRRVPAGIYLVRLNTPTGHRTQKLAYRPAGPR